MEPALNSCPAWRVSAPPWIPGCLLGLLLSCPSSLGSGPIHSVELPLGGWPGARHSGESQPSFRMPHPRGGHYSCEKRQTVVPKATVEVPGRRPHFTWGAERLPRKPTSLHAALVSSQEPGMLAAVGTHSSVRMPQLRFSSWSQTASPGFPEFIRTSSHLHLHISSQTHKSSRTFYQQGSLAFPSALPFLWVETGLSGTPACRHCSLNGIFLLR